MFLNRLIGERKEVALLAALYVPQAQLSMPAKQTLPDHNLGRGKRTLDFLLVPQTSKMCHTGKSKGFTQSTQLAASHGGRGLISRLTQAQITT